MSWEIIKGPIEMIVKEIIKYVAELIQQWIKKDIKTCKEIERKPAHVYRLQPTDSCVSQTYDLLVYRKLAPDQYGLEPREMPQELMSGESLPIPFEFIIKAGAVHLTIRANVLSNVPVRLAIYQWQRNAQEREVWATQPSTQIVDADTVDLKAPGFYELRIENPSSNTANAHILGTLDVTICGDPAFESWLWQYMSTIKYVTLSGAETPMAPMGIAVYGVKEDGGYILTTDAVKGWSIYRPTSRPPAIGGTAPTTGKPSRCN